MGHALDELGPEECRRIAEELFKVEKDYASRQVLDGFCPIHGETERSKSSSFAYHYGEDWYKCRSCGAGGDLVKLWCEIHGLDSRADGFKAFKEEFVGSVPGPRSRVPSRKTNSPRPETGDSGLEIYVDEADLAALHPLPAERVQEMKISRGWSPVVIERLDLREFDEGRARKIAIPIRDDAGRLRNIRLYQPGAAQFKVISWYDRACRACGGFWKKTANKAKVCKECGASPNDYGRTHLYPAPSQWKPSGQLWLVEGEPDLICALSQGLNAVTQTAGCGTWREDFSQAMAGRDVVIAYDADEAGWKGARKAAESIAKHAKSVRVLRWPEGMGNV